jgi:hypothetical protein
VTIINQRRRTTMLPMLNLAEEQVELDAAEARMRELKYSDADIEDELARIRWRHERMRGKPDAYLEAARQEKALRIALALWSGLDENARRDVRTGALLSHASQSIRDGFAKLARTPSGMPTKSPSEETWRRVVQLVCELVNAQRRGATEPCASCEEGEVAVQACSHSGPCPCGDDHVQCSRCSGTDKRMCDDCGALPATVVVPEGFYCACCAAEAAA